MAVKATAAEFVKAPVCATCSDYVDYPGNKLIARDGEWLHYETAESRCPGQEDDDTDDEAEPLMEGDRYVVAYDESGRTFTAIPA